MGVDLGGQTRRVHRMILSKNEVLRGIKAQHMVESAITEYKFGSDIFHTINDQHDTTYHDDELYVFVFDEDRVVVDFQTR